MHSVVLLDVRLLVAADVAIAATFLSLHILPDLRHDERVKGLVWELMFGERRYVGSNIQLEVVNR